MTLQEIINDVRGQINETDPANSHVTDAQLITWINQCTEQLCSMQHSFPKVQLSGVYMDANPLTLDENLISIDYASIYLNSKHNRLIPIDFDSFVKQFPGWETDMDNATSSTIPQYLVRMDTTDWKLFPWYDRTIADQALMTIIGRVLPDDVTDVTKEPPLHKVLHPAYVFYVLWQVWPKLNNPQKAQAAFQTYDALRQRNLRAATQTQAGPLHLRQIGAD